jgi:hypothetical protein
MAAKRPSRDWSIEEKIRMLAKASTLTGAELSDCPGAGEDEDDGTNEEHEP